MNKIQSLVLYFLAALFCGVILFFAQKRKSKVLTVVALLIPILLTVFRNNVGIDYVSYINMNERLGALSIGEYLNNMIAEPLFYLIAQIVKFFGANHFLFFAIPAVISVLAYYFALKNLKVKYIYIILPMIMLGIIYITDWALVRQGVAGAVLFLGFSYLLNGKKSKFFLLAMASVMFHKMSFLAIILYLVSYFYIRGGTQKLRLRAVLVALAILLPVVLFATAGIPYVQHYLNLYQKTGFNIFEQWALVLYGASMLIIYFNKKIVEQLDYGNIYYVLSCIGLVLCSSGLYVDTIERMAVFFQPFVFILLAYIFMEKMKKGLVALPIICVAIIIAPTCVQFVKAQYLYQYNIFPYHTIFERIEYLQKKDLYETKNK